MCQQQSEGQMNDPKPTEWGQNLALGATKANKPNLNLPLDHIRAKVTINPTVIGLREDLSRQQESVFFYALII